MPRCSATPHKRAYPSIVPHTCPRYVRKEKIEAGDEVRRFFFHLLIPKLSPLTTSFAIRHGVEIGYMPLFPHLPLLMFPFATPPPRFDIHLPRAVPATYASKKVRTPLQNLFLR